MNLFRNLLFWITLALAGALVAQLLVQDPGFVLVESANAAGETVTALPGPSAVVLPTCRSVSMMIAARPRLSSVSPACRIV